MNKDGFKPIWVGIILGLLVVTAPQWLFSNQSHQSNYEAPWIYPSELPKH
ncbi:MAG: hypothetical protein ACRD3W_08655 [Terriglobales bacterium]